MDWLCLPTIVLRLLGLWRRDILPCRGRWRTATRKSTEFEIKRYLSGRFGSFPLRELDPFQLQIWLNKLAEGYSDAVVRHAFINLRAILKMARKLKFLSENPAEDLDMPETREVARPVISAEHICKLIDGVEYLRNRALLCVGLFCATRASETFGLTWKSYLGDRLLVQSTAFEGVLYEGKVKTRGSKTTVPLPEDIRPVIEAWKGVCEDRSPNALMFPTFGLGKGGTIRSFSFEELPPLQDRADCRASWHS